MIKKIYLNFLLLSMLLIVQAACAYQERSNPINRKTVTIDANILYSCSNSNYIAEVIINNIYDFDIKVNVYDIGVRTPPHQSSFDIYTNDQAKEITYQGKTVNKDGVDVSDEIEVIEQGKILSFKYNLSEHYGIKPSDDVSYIINYAAGATSEKGPKVIYLESKEQVLDSSTCDKREQDE